MLLPFFSIALWSKQILRIWICSIRFGIFAISVASVISADDPAVSSFSTFSVDWNGSVFLISGEALNPQPFPSLTLYENNFYKFEHNGVFSTLVKPIDVSPKTDSESEEEEEEEEEEQERSSEAESLNDL